jgi:hypothetical protein
MLDPKERPMFAEVRGAVALLLFAACVPDRPPRVVTDAALPDAGASADAGQSPDAAPPMSFDAGVVTPDAGLIDGGLSDTGVVDRPDALAPEDAAPSAGPARYSELEIHSPITDSVAERLRAIAGAQARTEDVFAKVGDSNTVSSGFLNCFVGPLVELDTHLALLDTLDFFRGGDASGTPPFNRTSLAATIGWSAWSPISGSPSPLTREIDAIEPRIAVIMFGTNDVETRNIYRFGESMMDIADQLVRGGTIPIITSAPPRDDDAVSDAWIPRFNAVARGIAEARQTPFVDLERALRAVPGHGLGPDGIHLESYPTGARACSFTAAGLTHGHNVRNLLTLEALERARFALEGRASPDASAPALVGRGVAAEPYLIDRLPFTDTRDTRAQGERLISAYDACAPQDESGPEIVYRFEVTARTAISAFVIARGQSDIDLHLLNGRAEPSACVQRNDRTISATLDPGTWYFVLDTYVANGTELPGEFLFAVVAEP